MRRDDSGMVLGDPRAGERDPRAALRAAALALLGLASMACGPSLHFQRTHLHAFAAPPGCSQGPFTIELETVGARWEEQVRVYAFSPNMTGMSVDVMLGERSARTSIYSRDRQFSVREANRCVADEEAVAAATSAGGGSGAPSAPSADTPADTPIGEVDAPRPPEGSVELTLRPIRWPHPGVDLPSGELQRAGFWRHETSGGFGIPAFRSNDPENEPATEPGLPLTVRIWSSVPEDLTNTTFVILQGRMVPDNEEEYLEQIRNQRLEREAQARARRDEQHARNIARVERERFCYANREDEGCWGPRGDMTQQERERDRQRERSARTRQEGVARAQRSAATDYFHPTGPPSSPRSETRSPRPSVNASWINGYWHWDGYGRDWHWIAGRWEVPEEDVQEERTVQAPEAPPPPRAENAGSPPARGMVWIPGFWQWDGQAFIWIEGRWGIPQGEGARWQVPSWRPEARGRGVIFIPGGWRAR